MHTIEVVYDPTTRRISLTQNTDKYGGATSDNNSVAIRVYGIEPEGDNFRARVDFNVQVMTNAHTYQHPYVELEPEFAEEQTLRGLSPPPQYSAPWSGVIPGAVLAATEQTHNKLQFQLLLASDDYVINSRNTITLEVTQAISAQSDDLPMPELPDWEIPDGQIPEYVDLHTVELEYDPDTRNLSFVDEKSKYGGSTIDTNSVAIIVTSASAQQTTRGGNSLFKARIDFAVPVIVENGIAVKPFISLRPIGNALIAMVPQPVLMAARELKKLPLQLVIREGDAIINSRNTITLDITRAINALQTINNVYAPDLMFRDDTWEWMEDYTYSIGSVVVYDGAIYISLADDNLGNNPAETEGMYWTIPASATIQLNGQATALSNDVSIYAPSSAGTNGQILISNGSGEPAWQDSIENYAKKVSEERVIYSEGESSITLSHDLGDYPSSVLVFERSGAPGAYKWNRVDVAYEATEDEIILKFAVPVPYGVAFKIKALI